MADGAHKASHINWIKWIKTGELLTGLALRHRSTQQLTCAGINQIFLNFGYAWIGNLPR